MIKLFKNKSPRLEKRQIVGEIYICKLPNSVFTNAIFTVMPRTPDDDPDRINIQILMVPERPAKINPKYIQQSLVIGQRRSVHVESDVSKYSVLLSSLENENVS